MISESTEDEADMQVNLDDEAKSKDARGKYRRIKSHLQKHAGRTRSQGVGAQSEVFEKEATGL